MAFLTLTLILATMLFVAPAIASDVSLAGGLIQLFGENPAHLSLETNVDHFLNSTQYRQVAASVSGVDGVSHVEIVAHRLTYERYFFAINNDSKIFNAMQVEAGPNWLGANETYIITGSPSVNEYPPGSQVEIYISCGLGEDRYRVTFNLTVVGRVSLIPAHQKIAWMDYFIEPFPEARIWEVSVDNFMLNWDATFAPLIDILIQNTSFFTIGTMINIGLDLQSVINPYDLSGMLNRVESTVELIEPVVAESQMVLQNWIAESQEFILFDISTHVNQLLIAMLPSMVLAVVVAKIVGDLTQRQRQRIIRLFMARGVPSSTIQKAGAVEGLTVFSVSGIVGLVAAGGLVMLLVNPPVLSWAPLFSMTTLIMTFAFSGLATFLAVLNPMWQITSAELDPPLSPPRTNRSLRWRMLTWVLFFLGLYRILSWYIGFDTRILAEGVTQISTLMTLYLWTAIHDTLSWVAPLLFIYGLSQILTEELPALSKAIIQGVGRLAGEIGTFSAKFSTRRLSRVATLLFLLGLVGSYTVWAMSLNATYQDQTVRSGYITVGGDLRVYLGASANLSQWAEMLLQYQGIQQTTPEVELAGVTSLGPRVLHAIDPQQWLFTAYFEEQWFIGIPAHQALAALAGDNHSIILDMALGSQLSLDLGDDIQMTFPEINETIPLRVIGFFRRSVPYTRPSGGELQASWSFVSLALLNELNSSLSTQNQIVVKMQDPNAGMLLEEQIAGSSPDVLRVVSVASYVTTILGNRLLRAPLDTMLMISLLGAGLMVIGVVSISSLAVEERAHDLQILSMRGFSSTSLLTSVSIEYIALLLMALPVLFFVGIGWGVGSIHALNNPYLLAKAQQATSFRFILTGGHFAWIGGLVLSGSLALFVPAIFAMVRANRNVEELGERGWL